MTHEAHRVRLVQNLPNNETHSLLLDLPSREDLRVEYYLRVDSATPPKRENLRIRVSTEPEARLSSAAVLHCCPTLVELQGIQSDVYVKGASWNNGPSSKSPEKRSLSVGACRFQLWPNDTFYIGDRKLQIFLDSTVRSSMPDPESSPPPAPPSSRPIRLEPGATIMETPSKDPGSAKIIKTLASNALRGNEDSQNWLTDDLKRSTLFNIRDAKRQHESSPDPASEGPQIPVNYLAPSKVVCQDSVDPRNLEYQHFSELGGEPTESPTAPSQGETQVKDESQASNVKHANALLAIVSQNEPPSSPVERSSTSDLAAAATEDADQFDTTLKQGDANPPMTNVGMGEPTLEPATLVDVVMQDHEDVGDINKNASNGVHSQATYKSHPAAAAEEAQRIDTDDSPERARKRVKFAHNHDVRDTFQALDNPDVDTTTDEEHSENESPEKPDAGVAATHHHKSSEQPSKHPSDVSPASLNDQTPKTTPQLREKSASPRVQKKSASSKRTSKPRKSLTTPERPLEPSSSRSTRSAASDTTAKPQDPAAAIRVLFASSTTIDKSKAFMKFLSARGVQTATSINDCTILCVGKDAELKKTSNLILAVLNGKSVITDSWIKDSANAKELLDYEDYKATDPSAEEEWGTTLADAISRGIDGVKPFTDWTFCFTPAVKNELGKGIADIKIICMEAGAESIQATLPRKGPQEPCRTIMIAASNDKDTAILHGRGWKTYSKDIITLSVLRGNLKPESEEFEIQAKDPPQTGKGKTSPQTGKGKPSPQTGKSKTPQTGNSKKRKR